jgi:CheY-like chemotaxis protein
MMETEKVAVLVVDDDPGIRQLCADVLSEEGYVVHTASNGQEALTRIEHNSFKVALIDIMMPIMDGMQLCRILRSREATRQLPIIVMSAATNLANKATEILANGVLVKPFEIDKLLSCVKQLAVS